MQNQKFKQMLARKPNSNKNDFGHVLVVGGDYGYFGAVIMAAEACYKAGSGKVSVLTREQNFAPLLARLPNAMTVLGENLDEKILANKTVIIIGCGLGLGAWAYELFEKTLASKLPKLLDADALNILSQSQKKYDLSNCIITPHVGEAARLLKISTQEVDQNRQLATKKLYEKFGSTVVLKGKSTLVLGLRGQIEQCAYGNSGMAVAGMGDVLSGIIGGLMAQHLDNEKAAICGVNIHALAGDLVAKEQGEIGMLPTDLFKQIPRIINDKIG